VLKEKIWANFQRICELFSQKLSLSSQKHGFGIRDLRSRIWDPEKPFPDPGSRGQKGTGSRICNTDYNYHCYLAQSYLHFYSMYLESKGFYLSYLTVVRKDGLRVA
jgi:hypothetical protein